MMGIFYERAPSARDHVADAIEEALKEPGRAGPAVAAEAKKRAAKAKQDAKKDTGLKVGRVAVAIAIAAALIIGAIVLSAMVDTQAIAEAGKVAQNPAYKPPDVTGLKSAAEWLRTLGAAWSAGLVAVLLTEKPATGG
jgi:hypothetical protein